MPHFDPPQDDLPPAKKLRLSASAKDDPKACNTEKTKSKENDNEFTSKYNSNKRKQRSKGKNKNDYSGFSYKSAKFEKYYKSQNILSNDDEYDLFFQTLKRELPTAFRINQSCPIANKLKEKMKNDAFNLANVEKDGLKVEKIEFKKPFEMVWYPNELGWQCPFPKRYFNKGDARHRKEIKEFRNFLIEMTDSGSISRQEAVSMIPPLFLNIENSDHIMLDVCAAPGSKTTQMVEQLHYSLDGKRIVDQPNGFVVANDSDQRRAHILVHQLKRLCSGNYIVINKLGQCIPRPRVTVTRNIECKDNENENGNGNGNKNDESTNLIQFDRILCDVPCSSDGTMRKSPELWDRWNAQFGCGLHRIQLSILLRAIELCQVGGRIVYSTCTFNPIENEAVIAAALMKCNQYYTNENDISVELLDVSNELPNLRRNKGLKTWKIWDKECNQCFEKFEDIPLIDRKRKQYLASMFPPNEYLNYLKLEKHEEKKCNFDNSVVSEMIKKSKLDGDSLVNKHLNLERCMRFIPFYHDTGGFFVAVLTKKSKVSFIANSKNDKQDELGKDENENSNDNNDNNDERMEKDRKEREAHMYKVESKEFNHRNYWSDDIPYYYLRDLKEIEKSKDNDKDNNKEEKKKSKFMDHFIVDSDKSVNNANFGKSQLFKIAKHYGINIDLFLKDNKNVMFKKVKKQSDGLFNKKDKFSYCDSLQCADFDDKYETLIAKHSKIAKECDKNDNDNNNDNDNDNDNDKENDKSEFSYLSDKDDTKVVDESVEILKNEELLVRGLVNPKSVWFVPYTVGKVVSNRENDQLRIVQSGIRAFARHGNEQSLHKNHCRWRITQEGVPFLTKYLTKQICKIPLKLYLYFAYTQQIVFDDWINKEENSIKYGYYIEHIKLQNGGGCILLLDKDNDNENEHKNNTMENRWDCLPCWKSNSRIDLMIGKPELKLTRMYLSRIYPSQTEDILKEFKNIDLNNLKHPHYHNDPYYGMTKEERIAKGVGLQSINEGCNKKKKSKGNNKRKNENTNDKTTNNKNTNNENNNENNKVDNGDAGGAAGGAGSAATADDDDMILVD